MIYVCKVMLHYRLLFKFLTSIVGLWHLSYICATERRRFTEMQNPWDAKMLNVYLVSVECITDRELCKVMLMQRRTFGATSKLLIEARKSSSCSCCLSSLSTMSP